MSDEELVPEEDEEQEKHKTGRSAFFAGVYAADSFTGSFRGVPAPPHGGAMGVRPEDVIGSPGTCWCGQPIGHAWPGKDLGVAHPREEQKMSTTTEEPYLDVRQLRKFDRRVVQMLKELVNTYGVPYRFTGRDGMHLLLYSLGGTGKTYKVSCSVQPETTLNSLEKWVGKEVTPHLVSRQAEALAAKLNDPEKRPHRPAPAPVASTPTPEPPAPQDPPPAPPEPAPAPTGQPPVPFSGEGAPTGYATWVNKKGETGPWWKRDGVDEWLCKDCGFVANEVSAIAGHRRVHNPELFQRKRAANYLLKAAEEMGITLSSDAPKLEREVERLTAQLEKVTRERDECKARLDLIREGLRA